MDGGAVAGGRAGGAGPWSPDARGGGGGTPAGGAAQPERPGGRGRAAGPAGPDVPPAPGGSARGGGTGLPVTAALPERPARSGRGLRPDLRWRVGALYEPRAPARPAQPADARSRGAIPVGPAEELRQRRGTARRHAAVGPARGRGGTGALRAGGVGATRAPDGGGGGALRRVALRGGGLPEGGRRRHGSARLPATHGAAGAHLGAGAAGVALRELHPVLRGPHDDGTGAAPGRGRRAVARAEAPALERSGVRSTGALGRLAALRRGAVLGVAPGRAGALRGREHTRLLPQHGALATPGRGGGPGSPGDGAPAGAGGLQRASGHARGRRAPRQEGTGHSHRSGERGGGVPAPERPPGGGGGLQRGRDVRGRREHGARAAGLGGEREARPPLSLGRVRGEPLPGIPEPLLGALHRQRAGERRPGTLFRARAPSDALRGRGARPPLVR